jgi:hypothetical protein
VDGRASLIARVSLASSFVLCSDFLWLITCYCHVIPRALIPRCAVRGWKGMSRRLLKFTGGPVDDYATCRSSPAATNTELTIARAHSADQRRHVRIPLRRRKS